MKSPSCLILLSVLLLSCLKISPLFCADDNVIREYWPSGKIKSEEPTVNDVRDGLAHYWCENGQPYSVIPWKKGKKDGAFSLYREDGSLEQELTYRDGRLEGICKWYYPNGQLSDEAEYHNNLANGRVTKYHPDGKLKFEAIYRNGQFEKYLDSNQDVRSSVDSQSKTPKKKSYQIWYKKPGFKFSSAGQSFFATLLLNALIFGVLAGAILSFIRRKR